jgi:hypothetical protein
LGIAGVGSIFGGDVNKSSTSGKAAEELKKEVELKKESSGTGLNLGGLKIAG